VKASFYAFLFTGLFFTVSARAHDGYWHHHHCLRESWDQVSNTVTSKGACLAKDPLELSEKWQSYPLLREDAYLVEYWKGSFSRQITSNQTVRHQILNLCSGKSVVDTTSTNVINEQKVFELANPNLKETISTSYELIPLTDAEANVAFAAARVSCENF
jgi:hypothetical protein